MVSQSATLFPLLGLVLLVACAPAPGRSEPTVEPTVPATAGPLTLDTAETEFGSFLRLEAARLLTPELHQGDKLGLELTWRLLRPTTRDFKVEVRLVDQDGKTRARRDLTIGGAGSGTSGWTPDAQGRDALEVQLPEAMEPGRYRLALAVADPASGVQIPLSAEAGLPPVVVETHQILGAVLVAPVRD